MLSFFPRDVLDEIWDLIESVSEGFPPTFPMSFLHNKHLRPLRDTFSHLLVLLGDDDFCCKMQRNF